MTRVRLRLYDRSAGRLLGRLLSRLPAVLRLLTAGGAAAAALAGGLGMAQSDTGTSEPAPVERIGPPRSDDAAVTATGRGSQVEIEPSRRSARLLARWDITAPPGPLRLTIPSTLFDLEFRLEPAPDGNAGPLRAESVERVEPVAQAAAPAPAAEVRIDPASGAAYAPEATPAPDGAAAPTPRASFVHTLSLIVPASGRLRLQAAARLSSGYDKRHWRRTAFEQSHLLHDRHDVFVYQFAARGPTGGIELAPPPPRTRASAAELQGTQHVAAAEQRAFPLGLTLGLGLAVGPDSPPGTPPQPTDSRTDGRVEGLLRIAADWLLPWRDALSLAAEAGSNAHAGHHAGLALTYQLYTPAFSYVPIAGHVDAGAVCDLWQTYFGGNVGSGSQRCGARLGAAVLAKFVGLSASVDLFPYRLVAAAPDVEPGTKMLYRVGLLATVGL